MQAFYHSLPVGHVTEMGTSACCAHLGGLAAGQGDKGHWKGQGTQCSHLPGLTGKNRFKEPQASDPEEGLEQNDVP